MIIELFGILLIVAIIFFIVGFQYENYPVFIVSGIFFLILSIGIYATGLTTITGVETKYIYGANFTDYHWDYYGEDSPTNPNDYELFHTIDENVYQSSEGVVNTTLGSLMLGLAFFSFGCALVFATPKKDRENDPNQQEWNYYD